MNVSMVASVALLAPLSQYQQEIERGLTIVLFRMRMLCELYSNLSLDWSSPLLADTIMFRCRPTHTSPLGSLFTSRMRQWWREHMLRGIMRTVLSASCMIVRSTF